MEGPQPERIGMTTRLEGCGCRWCADEHPGGMVLFVTLPSNQYVSKDHISRVTRHVGRYPDDHPDHPGELITETHEFTVASTFDPNMNKHTFGRLMIPPGGFDGRDIDDVVKLRIPWACDNGSFNVFDEPRFVQMMDRLANQPYCHFVAAPDVVWNKWPAPSDGTRYGDRHLSAIQTIEKFLKWAPFIRERGLPAAMVAQDGLERYDADIPWDQLDAWFVGGSDAWKTGAESEHYIREAQRRGLWTHIGRVSGKDRIRWCLAVGASSFDGSAFGRFRDAQDKSDGLGRLQAGLINAGSPVEDRLFVTDLEGNHDYGKEE